MSGWRAFAARAAAQAETVPGRLVVFVVLAVVVVAGVLAAHPGP